MKNDINSNRLYLQAPSSFQCHTNYQPSRIADSQCKISKFIASQSVHHIFNLFSFIRSLVLRSPNLWDNCLFDLSSIRGLVLAAPNLWDNCFLDFPSVRSLILASPNLWDDGFLDLSIVRSLVLASPNLWDDGMLDQFSGVRSLVLASPYLWSRDCSCN